MRDTRNASQSLKRGITTKWIMSRHKVKMEKMSKLRREIIELERQLKQHPLGAIILKATPKADVCHPCFLEVCKTGFKPVWQTWKKNDESNKWEIEEE